MPSDLRLNGKGILVTRPAHQAQQLITLIESHGGVAFPFPVMEIIPPQDITPALNLFRHLDRFDIAIFISANAARMGIKMMQQEGEIPKNLQLAAVGLATARTLEQAGYAANIIPESRFDSEGLLATPQLQEIEGKNILIVRGEGGRELLAKTLRGRGGDVTYAEIYRRIVPPTDPSTIIDAWKSNRIDAAVITSNQGLTNLLQMVGTAGKKFLLQTPLVVISERTREVARENGFSGKLMLATSPSDESILDTLSGWVEENSKG